ncbi:uncharacterized protein LOC122088818 isoform X1 [Macadamia integrifolia]|uniref:uncharacterized protein LOC122088818 isoform X1 n=1 Tax=Macadamia integrifolia TaxID=60698 RepID=UPI001C4FD867|nr:uncharacterized protein LOC122088818 isoform X1 [Macadamia integrifolia]
MECCCCATLSTSSSSTILNRQGLSSSPVGRRYSKNNLHQGLLSSSHSKHFLQLNGRVQPFYRQTTPLSLKTHRGSIVAEAGRQGWDFGRFLQTIYFFNGPPSPAKFFEFLIEKLSSTTASEPLKPMGTSDVILVAGATGGVGRRVVDIISKKGLPVRVLVRNEEKARRMLGQDVDLVSHLPIFETDLSL